jgi:hypothetical protein
MFMAYFLGKLRVLNAHSTTKYACYATDSKPVESVTVTHERCQQPEQVRFLYESHFTLVDDPHKVI